MLGGFATSSGLQTRDTADFKSALRWRQAVENTLKSKLQLALHHDPTLK